jgi:hypothetical protein
MIKDKYPTRTDLINSITETRGVGKSKLYYKNGKVVYKKETHGSKYKEVKKFIQDLHTFPWFKPVPNLDKEKIVALVQEHITVLGKYGYKKNKISVKFVNTWGAARDNDWNTAYNAAYNAAFVATYDAARSAMYYDDCDVTWGTARSVIYYDGWDAAWGVAYNVARTAAVYAPWDAAREAIWCADKYAACLVADVDNPFSSYVEIYRLGCVPVGVVGKKFVVCIPPTKNP